MRSHDYQSLRQVINEPVWILDITSWKVWFVLNSLAALFCESCFSFLNALDSDFQDRFESRAGLNKQIDVFSVTADHIGVFICDRKAQTLDIELSGLHWILSLNQNIGSKCICHSHLRRKRSGLLFCSPPDSTRLSAL